MFSVQQIRENVKKHAPGWNTVPSEKIRVQKMTGITNLTFKIDTEQGGLNPMIYRKLGQSSSNIFLSRKEQTAIYEVLAKSGQGPQIYYADKSFRLEQFLQSIVLDAKKMLTPGYLQEVAISLSEYHRVKPDSKDISPQNLFKKTFINNQQKLMSICHNKLNQKIFDPEQEPIVEILKKWVSPAEIDYISAISQKYEKQGLVFSHNDLLANNVLFLKKNGQCIFIDYEYGSFNFPFYDIANYFQESMIDYEANEPPYFSLIPQKPEAKEMQIRFIDAYQIAMDIPREHFKAKFEQLRKDPKYIKKREIMIENLVVGKMLCNLMWGWWAIIVCKNPQINFDYIKFAKWRVDTYYECKKLLEK